MKDTPIGEAMFRHIFPLLIDCNDYFSGLIVPA